MTASVFPHSKCGVPTCKLNPQRKASHQPQPILRALPCIADQSGMASHVAVKAPAEPQGHSRTNIQTQTINVDVQRDSDSDNRVVDAPSTQSKHSNSAASKGRDYRQDPLWRTSANLPYPRLRDHPPDPFSQSNVQHLPPTTAIPTQDTNTSSLT